MQQKPNEKQSYCCPQDVRLALHAQPLARNEGVQSTLALYGPGLGNTVEIAAPVPTTSSRTSQLFEQSR